MSDFLQAIKTVSLDRNEQQPALTEVTASATTAIRSRGPTSTTPIKNIEDVVSNLRAQPAELDACRQLEWLLANRTEGSDVLVPSPRSATLLRVIIDATIPDLWSASESIRSLLCRSLSSVPGISGLITTLASASVAAERKVANIKQNPSVHETPYLEVLERILGQDDLFSVLYHGIELNSNVNQRKLLWKDFSSLMASGKIISTVAKFQDATGSVRQCWLASGSTYTSHVSVWTLKFAMDVAHSGDGSQAAASLLAKSFALGYSDVLIARLCKESIEMAPKGLDALASLSKHLRALDQRRLLGFLPLAVQQTIGVSLDTALSIRRISAVISAILKGNDALRRELVSWLQTPRVTCAVAHITRRALMAVISDNVQDVESVLEKSLQVFGELLFIRHAPAVEQESCAEIILLAAGRLKQANPSALVPLARSSVHTNSISGRLAAPSQRSRALGMIVGMGISKLVDKDKQRMDFGVEDVQTPFAKQLLDLTDVHDDVGTLDDVKIINQTLPLKPSEPQVQRPTPMKVNPVKSKIQSIPTSGPRIIEVLSDDEDDDLAPYTKPDSDPEDEDEDPTLVNRDKPRAPVYIRDLMSGLRDEENYDRHKVSLESAGPLIRRKAQFGKEVSDHAIELSTILIGLQNTLELDDFIELRLQALITLLLSDPSELGPWYSRQVFEGDYSLSQRGTILSAIGLAARELAGFKDVDSLNPQITEPKTFPSKRLPDKYHSIYASPPRSQSALPPSPLNAISASLTDSIIAPLAAQAADSATGPSALKVRTFSSRLSSTDNKRTRIIPNALATTVAESFFTPLVGHFYTHTRASTGGRRAAVFTSSVFLGTYLTTLAVLLHAAGPSTRALDQLTSDFWALLLGVRSHAKDDVAVLQAWLFGALTLLELHGGDPRNIATNYGRELVETRDWVSDVYGRLAGGEEEADRVRGLAAGVLVKCGEVMEKYERLLVGEMMQY